MVPVFCIPEFLIAYSNDTLKRRHASASPCQTPLSVVKGAESLDWTLIWLCMLDIVTLTNLINSSEMFNLFMASYICPLSMLSYALLNSIKSKLNLTYTLLTALQQLSINRPYRLLTFQVQNIISIFKGQVILHSVQVQGHVKHSVTC